MPLSCYCVIIASDILYSKTLTSLVLIIRSQKCLKLNLIGPRLLANDQISDYENPLNSFCGHRPQKHRDRNLSHRLSGSYLGIYQLQKYLKFCFGSFHRKADNRLRNGAVATLDTKVHDPHSRGH